MSKKKPEPETVPDYMAYMGRYYQAHNHKLFDRFCRCDKQGLLKFKHDESMDILIYDKFVKQWEYRIGQVLMVPKLKGSNSWLFHKTEKLEVDVADCYREVWSIENASAVAAHGEAVARRKLITESKDAWRELLEPIRIAYKQGNANTRRAIRTLVIEQITR